MAVSMRASAWCSALGAICALGASVSLRATSAAGGVTTLQLPAGRVIGSVLPDGTLTFRNVRYARPPVGKLRFQPPQPLPADASRVLNDLAPGRGCAQSMAKGWEHEYPPLAEDCLIVNVWTRGLERGRRPVMVWIHGGGFMGGSGSAANYDGARLAARGDVVVVTVNYRLGALGFLDQSESGRAEFAESGNAAILDQIAALRWVQGNIAAFGGDPARVTVFGESAGGRSVTTLLSLPQARGLFSRAIVQSGSGNTVRSLEYARLVTRKLFGHAGVRDIEALQAMPIEKFLLAQKALSDEIQEKSFLFGPVLDGVVLKESPLRSIARGAGSRVPVMHGVLRDEWRLWSLFDPAYSRLVPEDAFSGTFLPLHKALGGKERAQRIIEAYQGLYPQLDGNGLYFALMTDVVYRIPHLRLADALNAAAVPNWMYVFEWPSPSPGLGTPHGLELPFVFGNTDTPGMADFIGKRPPRRLVDFMQDTWLAFARDGAPTNLRGWERHDAVSRMVASLNLEPGLLRDAFARERAAWAGVPFDGISPSVEWSPRLVARK